MYNLVGISLRGQRGKWEENIDTNVSEICSEDGNWMGLDEECVQRQTLLLNVAHSQFLEHTCMGVDFAPSQ